MKNRILSILAIGLISSGLFAQSLSLVNADGPVPNNGWDTVQSPDNHNALIMYMGVSNTTGNNLEVMCKKTEISVVPNTMNYFCWFQCYGPNVFVGPDPLMIPANTTNSLSFSGDYDPLGEFGTSIVRYTFFLQSNPMDSVCFNAVFVVGNVGIGEDMAAKVKFSGAYPNPATSTVSFDYSFPPSALAGAKMEIHDLLGSVVRNIPFEDAQGKLTVDVTGLNPGIYFYSVVLNNTAVQTRKFVVK